MCHILRLAASSLSRPTWIISLVGNFSGKRITPTKSRTPHLHHWWVITCFKLCEIVENKFTWREEIMVLVTDLSGIEETVDRWWRGIKNAQKSKDGGETAATSWLQVCMKRHNNSTRRIHCVLLISKVKLCILGHGPTSLLLLLFYHECTGHVGMMKST